MSMIIKHYAIGEVDSKYKDARGLERWTYCVLNGIKDTKFVIITAYRI